MAIDTAAQPPIYIQSAKVIDWLLKRKLLPKNYPKRLEKINEKFRNAIPLLGENDASALKALIPYYTCVDALEAIQSTEVNTGFFSRSSEKLRTWKDLVDDYRKDAVYIAEIGEKVNEIASVTVPRCRTTVSDRQKDIIYLRQKIKQHHLNIAQKVDVMDKAFREFNMQHNETSIKLLLLREASKLPLLLDQYVKDLTDLSAALNIYKTFRSYLLKDSGANSNDSDLKCCTTLQLLINSGHVYMFTWQHGYPPTKVEADDDFIQLLLSQEEQNIKAIKKLSEPALTSPTAGITWSDNDDAEIDFGDELDFVIEVGESQTDRAAVDVLVDDLETGMPEIVASDVNCARGRTSRRLLDTEEGRRALLNDLIELSAFLDRLHEDLLECQDWGSSGCDAGSSKRSGVSSGSVTLQQVIMQSAPQAIQSLTPETVGQLLSHVDLARQKLTNSSISQLLLIRQKPGYLERVVSRLETVRVQAGRARDRVVEAQLLIDRAQQEQEEQSAALQRHRSDGKRLVTLLEDEISKLCKRPVHIIGQILDI